MDSAVSLAQNWGLCIRYIISTVSSFGNYKMTYVFPFCPQRLTHLHLFVSQLTQNEFSNGLFGNVRHHLVFIYFKVVNITQSILQWKTRKKTLLFNVIIKLCFWILKFHLLHWNTVEQKSWIQESVHVLLLSILSEYFLYSGLCKTQEREFLPCLI